MATRSLGTLTLDLVAKIGGFEQGMDRAARKADNTARKIENAGKAIGKAIGIAFTAAVAAAGAVTLALGKSIDRMDDLSKAAQRASLPTEDFTRFAYAGSLADVSMEDLTKSFGKLAKAQGDAQAGLKTQTDAFKQLGIDFEDANGHLRSTKDVFLDFADVFQKYQGTPEVVAAGMQIFGRSFQTLIPLLKDGSAGLQAAADEADRLGITLSTKAGKAAEAFNDNSTRLKTVLDGLIQSVAVDLLPDLVKLSEEFVSSATSGDSLKNSAHEIANAFREIVGAIKAAAQVLSLFKDQYNQFNFGGKDLGDTYIPSAAESFSASVKAQLAVAKGDFEEAGKQQAIAYAGAWGKEIKKSVSFDIPKALQLDIGGKPFNAATTPAFSLINPKAPQVDRLPSNAPTPKGGSKKSGGKSDAQREAEQLQASYDRMVASLNQQIALTGDVSDVEKLRYELANGELAKLDPAQKQQLLNLQATAEARQNDYDELQKTIRLEEEQTRARDEGIQRTDDLIKSMQFELDLLGMTNEQRRHAIALRYADANATGEQKQAILDLSDSLEAAHEQQAFFDDLKASLSDTFVDFISGAKSAKEAFGDFADYIYKQALKFVADKAIQALFDSFSGAGSSSASGGSGGGFWSSLIGAFTSGSRAVGGPVTAGGLYEVGESDRPETFFSNGKQYMIPGNNGTVVPGAGGGVTQNLHFILPRRIDNRNQQQIAQAAGTAAQTAIRRNRR